MKISEVITELKKIKKEYGDVRVTKFNAGSGDSVINVNPKIAWTAKLKGRTKNNRYWFDYSQPEWKENKDETVVQM